MTPAPARAAADPRPPRPEYQDLFREPVYEDGPYDRGGADDEDEDS